MRIKSNKLIAIEGLDGTGKTTLIEEMKKTFPTILEDPQPIFTHSPSGSTVVGKLVYEITEQADDLNLLSRQFLHLAAHAEEYSSTILPALASGSVIMDRNWWSAIAYGAEWAKDAGVSRDFWEKVVRLPTQGRETDLVILCMDPYIEDKHNTKFVEEAYWDLAETYPGSVALLPKGTIAERMDQFWSICYRTGVLDD